MYVYYVYFIIIYIWYTHVFGCLSQKKKLEAQLAALQATEEELQAEAAREADRQEGWVEVSVEEKKPELAAADVRQCMHYICKKIDIFYPTIIRGG